MSLLWWGALLGTIIIESILVCAIWKLVKRIGKLEREQMRLYRAISRILAGELPRKVEP